VQDETSASLTEAFGAENWKMRMGSRIRVAEMPCPSFCYLSSRLVTEGL